MTGITSLLKIKKITERSWFQKKKKKSELTSPTDSAALLILLPLNVKINQLGEDGVLM